jgi:hypothetical protein
VPSISLALPVILPPLPRFGNVPALFAFGSATQQDYRSDGTRLPDAAEIDPVSRAEVDSPFRNPCPDGGDVSEISRLDPMQDGNNSRRGNRVQTVKPVCERRTTVSGDAFLDLYHGKVTSTLLIVKAQWLKLRFAEAGGNGRWGDDPGARNLFSSSEFLDPPQNQRYT